MKGHDDYKLATPPYCDDDVEEITGQLEIIIMGDVDKIKQFEERIKSITDELDLEVYL